MKTLVRFASWRLAIARPEEVKLEKKEHVNFATVLTYENNRHYVMNGRKKGFRRTHSGKTYPGRRRGNLRSISFLERSL